MYRNLLPLATGILLAACSNSSATEVVDSEDSVAMGQEEQLASLTCSPDSVTLVFFGDAMQHQGQLDRARALGTTSNPYEYDSSFTLISPAVEEADYAVVNLELPLGGGPDYSGYPQFSAPDSYAKSLKKAGFDLFLTSNNHCLDRRDKGLRRTLEVLDELGVDHIGTYNDANERSRKVPFIKEINGMKIGFLNYTYGTNGIVATAGAEVAYINREKMKEELEQTRKAGAEFIVVLPHWGVEYVLNENKEQRSLAEFLLKAGADMIIGGHPHVVQPMKLVTDTATGKRSLTVYSLGNFISNMKTKDTRGGAFVRVVLERDSNNNVIIRNAGYDTFITEKPTAPGTNYRVVPRWSIDSLPSSQRGYWVQHNTDVQNLYDRYNIGVPRLTVDYSKIKE